MWLSLGRFCSYYQRLVEGFAKIFWLLNDLLKRMRTSIQTYQLAKQTGRSRRPRGLIYEKWTDQCAQAFCQKKRSLANGPVLACADITKPYELHVDASWHGLGRVLYQEHDGSLWPIAYVSWSLTPAEKNDSMHKLAFFTFKWIVVDKLKAYLYSADFLVKTYNNPLI